MALQVKITNQKGSTLLESLFALQIITVFISFIFVGSYIGLVKFWIKHELQASLICLAKENSKNTCKRKLRENLQHIPMLGKLKTKLEVNTMKISGQVDWTLGEETIWKEFIGLTNIKLSEKQSLEKHRLIRPRSRIKKVWL